jgi:cytochrome c-type biogenesis protein CcmE
MTGIQFSLADKERPGETIRVSYSGAVPDSFKPGVEVIVEGSMQAPDSIFAAHTLMTKCPSKYKK